MTEGGGAELCVTAGSEAEVDKSAAAWASKGVQIVQSPTRTDFGYTFVRLDRTDTGCGSLRRQAELAIPRLYKPFCFFRRMWNGKPFPHVGEA